MSSSENHHLQYHSSHPYHNCSWYGAESAPSAPPPAPPPYYPSPTSHSQGMASSNHHSYHQSHSSHHPYSQHAHHAASSSHSHSHAPSSHHGYYAGSSSYGTSTGSASGGAPLGYSYASYNGPVEGEADLDEASMSGRDSFYYPVAAPSHHNYAHAHAHTTATPVAPYMYNGPPVSALVPRFARNNENERHESYTPHVYDAAPEPGPFLGSLSDKDGSLLHDTVHLAAPRDDRRTSFGFPLTSQFLIPTPQLRPKEEHETPTSEDESLIPPPPDGPPSEPVASPALEPTMQDASLLLGLRTDAADASNQSPSTVPEMQDEMDDAGGSILRTIPASVSINQAKLDATAAAAAAATHKQALAELPKTCFPVPIPKTYPRSLALPNDSIKLNALHCYIRTDLLEIFVVEPSPEHLKFRHAPSSAVGRVGLRCVHCAMARTNTMNASRDDEAPMAVFYPKSVHEIYRLVTSWQRCHVRKCKSLPPSVRAVWEDLRETEKSRGKTAYWAEAARQIGMVDCPSRAGGIRFAVDESSAVESSTNATTDPVSPEGDENHNDTLEPLPNVASLRTVLSDQCQLDAV